MNAISSELRVLQVLPALKGGGVERGTIEIASALSSQKIYNLVASSGGELCEQLKLLNVPHHTLPFERKTPWHILSNGYKLASLVQSKNISLIHARSRAPAWSSLIASKLTGVPYITTFHGVYGHRSAAKRWYNSAMLRGLHCIAVSDFVAGHITNTYRKHPELEVINRGVDVDYFNPARVEEAQRQQLREQWRIRSKEGVLLFPARYSRSKGHHLLIEALAELPCDNWKVVFVGKMEGHERYIAELKTQVRALGLENVVVFSDHIAEMREAYSASDIVVMANTKPESFGRTLVEAQAMERRVIAPKLGAAESICSPELRDNLYEANSVESLKNKLLAIVSTSSDHNREQIRERTQAARAFVKTHFSLDSMCSSTLSLYRRIHQKTFTAHQ